MDSNPNKNFSNASNDDTQSEIPKLLLSQDCQKMEGHQIKKYIQHVCSPLCIFEIGVIKKMKQVKILPHSVFINQVSPFCVPFYFHWERKISSSKVFYVAPCGNKLSSMKKVFKYLVCTKSKLSIDQFNFDVFMSFQVAPSFSKFIVYNQDLSNGQENVNVECVNEFDDETIDKTFIYNPNRIPGPGVDLNFDANFLACCTCTDNCLDETTCDCQLRTFEEAVMLFGEETIGDSGYHYKKLKKSPLSLIYECNSQCKCNAHCQNRVVQNGIKHRFQVFKTLKKGWGTRCLHDIPEGDFICLYSGEVINQKTADEPGRCDAYLAQLNYIDGSSKPKIIEVDDLSLYSVSSSSSSADSGQFAFGFEMPTIESEQTAQMYDVDSLPLVKKYLPNNEMYCVDGKHVGNIGRFLNHSCDPNCQIRNIFVNSHDYRYPLIAFFSIKYIPALEELTWDYHYNPNLNYFEKKPCFCGSICCRQLLTNSN